MTNAWYHKQRYINNKGHYKQINAYQAIFILYDKSKFLFSSVSIF